MKNLECIFNIFFYNSYQPCGDVDNFPDLVFHLDHGAKYTLSGS